MTTQQPDPDIEELPAIDPEGGGEHPLELTEDEAARGHQTYLAVDDLDDDSTGLDDDPQDAP